jgi:hypothetical protein
MLLLQSWITMRRQRAALAGTGAGWGFCGGHLRIERRGLDLQSEKELRSSYLKGILFWGWLSDPGPMR